MKSVRTKFSHRMHRAGGWSLLEMTAVIAIMMIMATIATVSLQPVWKTNQISNAYDTVLMAFRNARQSAVNERHTYLVTFLGGTPNNTFTVQRYINGVADANPDGTTTYTLPRGLTFLNMTGIPNVSSQTPDSMGTGGYPIEFDCMTNGVCGQGASRSMIYFQPDGSARDALINGNLNSGVVYIADSVDLYSSRAITLMGPTGRVRGWRLIYASGQKRWLQQ